MIKKGILAPYHLWLYVSKQEANAEITFSPTYWTRTKSWLKTAVENFKRYIVDNPIKIFLAAIGICLAFLPPGKKLVDTAIKFVSPVTEKVATIVKPTADKIAKLSDDYLVQPAKHYAVSQSR